MIPVDFMSNWFLIGKSVTWTGSINPLLIDWATDFFYLCSNDSVANDYRFVARMRNEQSFLKLFIEQSNFHFVPDTNIINWNLPFNQYDFQVWQDSWTREIQQVSKGILSPTQWTLLLTLGTDTYYPIHKEGMLCYEMTPESFSLNFRGSFHNTAYPLCG